LASLPSAYPEAIW